MKNKDGLAGYMSSTILAVIFLLTANMLHAAGQSSTNYQIPTDVISGGGGGAAVVPAGLSACTGLC